MANALIKLPCPWCNKEIRVDEDVYRSGRFVCPECSTVIEMTDGLPPDGRPSATKTTGSDRTHRPSR